MNERLSFGAEIITKAGQELKNAFNKFERHSSELKSDRSFFTPEDMETEKMLTAKILEKYPNDGLLGEEGTHKEGTSGYRWIIDPIDGTTNFVYRLPLFTSSIGLTYNGEFIGGLIYLPILEKLFSVEKGAGFMVNNIPATVSQTSELEKCMTIFSIARKSHLVDINMQLYPIIFKNVQKVRVLGSISYELTLIASGLIDAVVNVGTEEWDVAGTILMVREAGGKVIDFHGNDWKPGSNTLIAGNEILVNKLAKVIKDNLITEFSY